jgi:hypothetical protein
MNAHTQIKPSYLGLLNAISLAETNAGVYLRAWADATEDDDLAATLRLVAARETSHGELFCRASPIPRPRRCWPSTPIPRSATARRSARRARSRAIRSARSTPSWPTACSTR